MKIGILTFHDAANYGALLQAYALQKTLADIGCESEFVSITLVFLYFFASFIEEGLLSSPCYHLELCI